MNSPKIILRRGKIEIENKEGIIELKNKKEILIKTKDDLNIIA